MTREKYEEIRSYLRDVIDGTQWEGKVYTVGGCLRDALMGRDIHDVDLAVNVPDGGVLFPIWLEEKGLLDRPPTLYRRFSSSRLRLRRFPDDEIEVVQTRREQYTDENSSNPEVCFGNLQDDCERRDLTINSLYQNVTTGEVLDLTGRAIADIENHRIDTPMAPDDTFSDDPIRILRTLRFAVKYGWEIPDEIMHSIKKNAPRMKIVRRPRISTEFRKIIESEDPVTILKLMKETGVMFKVLPELCHLYRVKDHTARKKVGSNGALPTLWDITVKALEQAGPRTDKRMAALFSQFHRIKAPYQMRERRDRRGKIHKDEGAAGVLATAMRRLMFDYSEIRRAQNQLEKFRNRYAPGVTEADAGKSGAAGKGGGGGVKKRRRRRRKKAKNTDETAGIAP